jgi:tryptophan halogenase
MKYNYVVVGGGTAGWLTALYVKKKFPYGEVTVIASSKIGVLGAGEGTTPQFLEFLDEVDIPVSEIIKHCAATFKNGIKFTNWNGDGEYYYHGFKESGTLDPDHANTSISYLHLEKIAQGKNLDEFNFTQHISEKQKVKYRKEDLEKFGGDALHFNARELAHYFETVGISRGITLIDDEVVDILSNEDGNITGFNLNAGPRVDADFVFDCTGFQRLIIGKFYNSKWISYKDSLPVNRAIPFFLNNDSTDLPPYTESIAMKYGWMWKIPVQGRYGCGYVFNKNLVSDDDIKKEIEDYIGHPVTFPTVFNFEAGAYDQVWIKNCCAIGLSSGFIEPLEATSIWVQIQTLRFFVQSFGGYLKGRDASVEYLNVNVQRMNRVILNFLYLHYITKRTDTLFWKDFTKDNIAPEGIEMLSEHLKTSLPDQVFFKELDSLLGYSAFNDQSWYSVGAGVKIFKSEVAQQQFELAVSDLTEYETSKTNHLSNIQSNSESMFNHWEYISYLKNENT